MFVDIGSRSKEFHAQPTKMCLALLTFHVVAASILLNYFTTKWATFRCSLSQKLVKKVVTLLLLSLFHCLLKFSTLSLPTDIAGKISNVRNLTTCTHSWKCLRHFPTS